MKLQIQPNRASCLLTSFAMCIDKDVKELFEMLGHDGTEVLYPELAVPFCYRGFKHEDLYYLGDALRIKLYFYPRNICVHDGEKLIEMINPHFRRIETCFDSAIVEARNHAVAWNGHTFYNPNGTIQSDFKYYQYIKVRK